LPAAKRNLTGRIAFFDFVLANPSIRNSCYISANGKSGAVWRYPSGAAYTPAPQEILDEADRLLALFGNRLSWVQGVFDAMEKLHPNGPHVYLTAIGTEQADRHHGLGTDILSAGETVARDRGLPIYLEVVRAENQHFFEARGYHVVHNVQIDKDVPHIIGMMKQF
jgi:GNAT superfamily N-acetyltransferase